jgi:chromosome segregation ATPase
MSLEDLQALVSSLQTELGSLAGQLDAYAATEASLRAELATVTAELENASVAKTAAETELVSVRLELNTTISDLTARISQLESGEVFAQLNAQLGVVGAERDVALTKLETLNAQIDAAQGQ